MAKELWAALAAVIVVVVVVAVILTRSRFKRAELAPTASQPGESPRDPRRLFGLSQTTASVF